MAVTIQNMARARARYLKADLKAVLATIKATGDPIYLVKSVSESAQHGFDVYHMVKLIKGKWRCDCRFGRVVGHVCMHAMCAYDTDVTAKKAAQDAERLAFRSTYSEFTYGC